MKRLNSPVPFGKPFAYTDPTALVPDPQPWYRALWHRVRKPRRPLGYVVVDGEDTAAAYLHLGGEVPVSPISCRFIHPVFDENILLAAWEQSGNSG